MRHPIGPENSHFSLERKQTMELSKKSRHSLLLFALIALLGPNGLYLQTLLTNPELNDAAMKNPIALAFIIEAFMLFGLFLYFIFKKTGSWMKVYIYLFMTFCGSLAFSFPLFIYLESTQRKTNKNLQKDS